MERRLAAQRKAPMRRAGEPASERGEAAPHEAPALGGYGGAQRDEAPRAPPTPPGSAPSITARPRHDVRRGALFDCAVQQLDAHQFWDLKRWVLKSAKLLFVYEPSRDGAPAAVLDLEAYEEVWVGDELALVRRSDAGDEIRVRLGDMIGAWQEATSRSYDELAGDVDELRIRAEAARVCFAGAEARGAALEAQLAQLEDAAVRGARDATALRLALAAAEADAARLAARAALREAALEAAVAAHTTAEAALAASQELAGRHAASLAGAASARLTRDQCDAARAVVDSQDARRRRSEHKILVDAVRNLRRQLDCAQRANLADVSAHWQEPDETGASPEAETQAEAEAENQASTEDDTSASTEARDSEWLRALVDMREDDDAACGARPIEALVSFRDLSSGATIEIGPPRSPLTAAAAESPSAARHALASATRLTRFALGKTSAFFKARFEALDPMGDPVGEQMGRRPSS
ncbi:hypothetical protein M885DRAFT_558375 [Pelagophyceae sp. CCMP2097]|nr:hypothetical protein M885DRAFT_558375 [Pelagophyceae sp. CCMP2097]